MTFASEGIRNGPAASEEEREPKTTKRQPATVTTLAGVTLPEPPIPRTAVVGGQYMPFHYDRYMQSEFHASASLAERWAGFQLWNEAWLRGVPTGSLPNNEKYLADKAGYGGDMRRWRQVKARAMHGFVLHADNKFYHMTQVEMVEEVLLRRSREAARKRASRRGAASENGGALPQDSRRTPAEHREDFGNFSGNPTNDDQRNQKVSPGCPVDVPPDSKGREENPSVSPSGDTGARGAAAVLAVPSEPEPGPIEDKLPTGDAFKGPPDPAQQLWMEGRRICRVMAGWDSKEAGPRIGRWMKDIGAKPIPLLHILRDAEAGRINDLTTYVSKRIKAEHGDGDQGGLKQPLRRGYAKTAPQRPMTPGERIAAKLSAQGRT